jgi:hypothetical protein
MGANGGMDAQSISIQVRSVYLRRVTVDQPCRFDAITRLFRLFPNGPIDAA